MASEQPGAATPGDVAGVTVAGGTAVPGGTAVAGAAGGTETAPPVYWPSPDLAAGQLVPDAYPAPPQPGRPGYGVPLAPSQARAGRPGYGQPRSGPGRLAGPAARGAPGVSGQAGHAGTAVSAPAAAALAGLAVASAWERLLAMTMDWFLILAASFVLLHEQMTQLVQRFQAAMVAAQTLGPGAEQTAVANFEKDPATVSALVSYFLMVFAMALVYFWALHATGGATLGKRALGLRVVRAADQAPAGIWACGLRTILFLLGPAMFTFSPGIGALGATVVSLLGAALWFADSVILATDPQKRSLHDKLAGTIVVRKAARRRRGR